MINADDRGNVVDFYLDGETVGRLDREAEPVGGMRWGYFFEGDVSIAIAEGYGDDVALAVICGFLQGDSAAEELAREYTTELYKSW